MTAPSPRTLLLSVTGLAAIVALWAFISASTSERAVMVASDLGGVLIVGAATAAVFLAARGVGPGPLRRQWLLIGAGMTLFVIGDAVWSWIELVQLAEVPYPGLPDPFYLLEYGLLAAGILSAGLAYRHVLDIRTPALLAGGLSLVAVAALWVLFLGSLAADAEASVGERVLSVAYPLFDVLLLAGPAVFTLLVVSRLQGGRLGRPWFAVAAGALVFAATDTVYSLLSAANAYESGMAVDFGWMVAHVLIATGALVMLDLATAARAPRVSEAPERAAA